jgi:hypothetical protein
VRFRAPLGRLQKDSLGNLLRRQWLNENASDVCINVGEREACGSPEDNVIARSDRVALRLLGGFPGRSLAVA